MTLYSHDQVQVTLMSDMSNIGATADLTIVTSRVTCFEKSQSFLQKEYFEKQA